MIAAQRGQSESDALNIQLVGQRRIGIAVQLGIFGD